MTERMTACQVYGVAVGEVGIAQYKASPHLCRTGKCQRPLNLGSRFSKKAFTASLWSSVRPVSD
jgi:hypothetical protein